MISVIMGVYNAEKTVLRAAEVAAIVWVAGLAALLLFFAAALIF